MNSLELLIQTLTKLPGIGGKSAERFALHMVTNKDSVMVPIRDAITKVIDSIRECDMCHNLCSLSPCDICSDSRRDTSILCVVENINDLWAIERSNSFNGIYHVIGGTISAIEGRMPQHLNINSLLTRISGLEEVLIAIKATIDGQTTAHYITDLIIKKFPHLKISRLASGIPIGAELNYMDDGTLSLAVQQRQDWSD